MKEGNMCSRLRCIHNQLIKYHRENVLIRFMIGVSRAAKVLIEASGELHK